MTIKVNHQYPVNVAEKHLSGKESRGGKSFEEYRQNGERGTVVQHHCCLQKCLQLPKILSSLRLSSTAHIKMFSYHAALAVSCSRINTCF